MVYFSKPFEVDLVCWDLSQDQSRSDAQLSCWNLITEATPLMPQPHIRWDHAIILLAASNCTIFQSWGGSMFFWIAITYDGMACSNCTELVTAAHEKILQPCPTMSSVTLRWYWGKVYDIGQSFNLLMVAVPWPWDDLEVIARISRSLQGYWEIGNILGYSAVTLR